MRRAALAWLALATVGCWVTDARELDPELQPARMDETVDEPAVPAQEPAPQPGDPASIGSDPGAFGDASGAPVARPPVRPGTAPNRASGPLKRIDTKPLSASANIALPQDI